jgi:hypothetical protein
MPQMITLGVPLQQAFSAVAWVLLVGKTGVQVYNREQLRLWRLGQRTGSPGPAII